MNRRTEAKKAPVDKSDTNSKWTAFVEKQIKSAIYDFMVILDA